MKLFLKIILIIPVVLVLTSCASTYNVDINSISSGSTPANKNYYLVAPKFINDDSLVFHKFSRYLDLVLSDKGYKRVHKKTDASVLILLAYGVGDPIKEIYSYSTPTYGQVGVKSSTTTGSVIGNYYSSTTTHEPKYGITGYQSHIGTSITYVSYLLISAFDAHSKKELWTSIVTSRGESNDVHLIYPVMLAASEPYIAQNTGHRINVNISNNNKRLNELNSIVNS